eukprot:scaffold2018_cov113-Cylindrotheca_fusiformis.AAC.15
MSVVDVVPLKAFSMVPDRLGRVRGNPSRPSMLQHPMSGSTGNDNNSGNDESKGSNKQGGIFQDFFSNFDDIVDDFLNKRMGNGEAFYGKRKYKPSGKVEGDYNGMGRSNHYQIELARVQREEMKFRKQQRQQEEENRRKNP